MRLRIAGLIVYTGFALSACAQNQEVGSSRTSQSDSVAAAIEQKGANNSDNATAVSSTTEIAANSDSNDERLRRVSGCNIV